jgi:hypothetical protein
VLEHVDARALAHPVDEGAGDLGPGLVPLRVDDAAPRVGGLAAELEAAAVGEVEVGAGGVELAHPVGALLHQHLHRGGVAQRGPGRQRVLSVEGRRVPGAERGRDPPLRVGRGRVEERALGEEEDVALLGGAPRRVEPGDAGADDEKSGAESVHAAKLHWPPRQQAGRPGEPPKEPGAPRAVYFPAVPMRPPRRRADRDPWLRTHDPFLPSRRAARRRRARARTARGRHARARAAAGGGGRRPRATSTRTSPARSRRPSS